MTIRFGSRESRLAVIQSRMVMDAVQAAEPRAELELVTMKTTGDKILDRTLDQIGGKGLFVKELDLALREGKVDFTIDQDLAYQSYQALTLLFRFLAEHKVPEQERFCPPSPILSAELVPDTE